MSESHKGPLRRLGVDGVILIATANAGKEREILEILGDLGVEFRTLRDYPDLESCVEDGATFAENARLKAAHYARLTGLPTLGDDSGLEVDALGGAPGVFSARYAGEGASDGDRIAKLLRELDWLGDVPRTARFVCAVSLMDRGGMEVAASGACEGEILRECRGEGGFGYDPVFWVPSLGETFAELSSEEKNRLSHRGRALQALRVKLLDL